MQMRQVDHILRGIFELALAQGALQPVRACLALGQFDFGNLRDELLVTEPRPEAGEGRGDLGVKQGCDRTRPGRERFEVFARAVHDDGAVRVGKQPGEWAGIERRSRIEQGDAPADLDLHQGQTRQPGVGAHEFGVESKSVRCVREQLRERVVTRNPVGQDELLVDGRRRRLQSGAASVDNPLTMPRTEVTRKQHTWGGAAGLALLGFALLYRFFPDALHLQPLEPATQGVAGVETSRAGRPANWSAVQGDAAPVVGEGNELEVGTSFADAVRMGPPAPVSKEVAALLKKARKAEGAGALLEPSEAIALYKQVLAAAPGNLEAHVALERIGGAMRDWTLAAVGRGDERAAQRFLSVYDELPHSDREIASVRERVERLQQTLPLLAHAAELVKKGRGEGGGENALAVYRQVLKLDPGNRLADAGLAAIERPHLDRALAQAAQDDFAGADATLAAAVSIRPGSQAMLETHTRIDDLRRQRAQTMLAQARSALDAGNADLAEQLARKAQATSPDLAGIDRFEQRLRNARLYASYKPGQVIRDPFADMAGNAPPVVVVPTGQFVMGSAADEEGHLDNEEPQRRVRIDTGFALGQSEVTVAEFAEFVGATRFVTDAERRGNAAIYDEGSGRIADRRGMSWRNAYDGSKARGDLPVVNVSWNDAIAYLQWLSERTGKHYRLPSEAEFEYAERAGSTTRYPWGDGNPEKIVANLTGEGDRSPNKRAWSHYFPRYSDGYWGPAPVRTYPANAFGLFDLDGNLSEWVEDCWHDNYTRAPRDSSAWVNPGCERHVVRGGSWGSDPLQVRSAFRTSAPADARSARVGFRVARDL